MINLDSPAHTTGKSLFLDDIPEPVGTLYAAAFTSTVAHGEVLKLDVEAARKMAGVHMVLTAQDIPGENQIGGIIQDEPLLAEKEIHFYGQPIAVIVAQSPKIAKKAAQLISCQVKEKPANYDPRIAAKKGDFICPPRLLNCGDVDAIWKKCHTVVPGRADSGSQEHLYLETQGSLAIPDEKGRLKIISGTQAPTAVQSTVAKVLNKSMNDVEVDVKRLGGAFGGKEDQATSWAVMAALAADKLNKPVKIVLDRRDDLRLTGKRHPYSSDFKIGLDKNKKILAYEVTFYQNAGAAADLSPAILERSIYHAVNSYFIPNVRIRALSCKTNLPPFTAFRGFGAPQGAFVMESAIERAAQKLNVDPTEIRQKNFLKQGDTLPFGMVIEKSNARACFDQATALAKIGTLKKDVRQFNAKNKLTKKGLSIQPICFGISFTNTMLNQASALVHIYKDGSVSISTAAIEMGQGVNMKMRGVAAQTLGIPVDRIFVDSTNTGRVANTSPTAASTGADLNGGATLLACEVLRDRLLKVAGVETPNWASLQDFKSLVLKAYMQRVSLSSQAYYATPGIYYDKKTERGRPFAYHVFGTAVTVVTLDCLRGSYKIDSVHIVHDVGKSLNPMIDKGQLEGALMQGIGWLTMEEVVYNDKGRLATDTLSTYKIPDFYFMPKEVKVKFLAGSHNPRAVLGSKALGEPPFLYGMGAYFALLHAMKAYKPKIDLEIAAPLTPERVLMELVKREA